jgi:single-stranded-DNA-specific exonuclease
MNDVSLLGKQWRILSADPSFTLLEKLLLNRGVESEEDTNLYLNPDFNKMHDPYLMHDMQNAVRIIQESIKNKDRIVIYGDYDVDGITGTAILVLVLQSLGAEVSYRLPHRVADGYGLTKAKIKEMSEVGTNLLITTDCGIGCKDEVALAKELGMKVIITDHHTVPEEIPNADAILHPKKTNCSYPFSELTGAGVAFKLVDALIKESFPASEREGQLRKYIDLATLGTVADLGPLVGENRIIVKEGLKQIKNTHWQGLKHLQEICGIRDDEDIHTNHVSYRLSPRLNAAGRLESAYIALQLFLSEGDDSLAKAQQLEIINKERQRLTELIMKEAEHIVKKQKEENILIAYHPSWHPGLIGIIAGRLASKMSKPTIIMEERDDTYVGSARGPEYFNLVDALGNHSKYLENFGGHVQAAGFTLKKDNKDVFVHSMQVHAREMLKTENTNPELKIDAELTFKDINSNTISQINRLRPFGMKNNRPVFLIKGVYLQNMRRVGHDRKHLLGKARIDTDDFKFIAFNMGDKHKEVPEFTRVDLACHLDVNTYNGKNTIELHVIDFKIASD